MPVARANGVRGHGICLRGVVIRAYYVCGDRSILRPLLNHHSPTRESRIVFLALLVRGQFRYALARGNATRDRAISLRGGDDSDDSDDDRETVAARRNRSDKSVRVSDRLDMPVPDITRRPLGNMSRRYNRGRGVFIAVARYRPVTGSSLKSGEASKLTASVATRHATRAPPQPRRRAPRPTALRHLPLVGGCCNINRGPPRQPCLLGGGSPAHPPHPSRPVCRHRRR
eukprot:1177303-Prorocentrum_minimum.AAC.2